MARSAAESAAPRRARSRGRFSLRAWAALLGLFLLLVGAWMLIPYGSDDDDVAGADANHALPTIVIDAGHGGHDNGAVRNGLREKELTLDTALRLEKKLRALGFPVVMTRRDDRFLELQDRCKVANRIPRAIFVSIHFNDNVSAVGDGVETYYAAEKVAPATEGWSAVGWFKQKPEPAPADNGLGLAHSVQSSVVSGLRAVDRGVKQARFAVIRHTRCAAVLVEGGFINNPAQARAIGKPDYREKLAAAIAEGVSAYQRQRVLESQKPNLAQAI